MKKVFIILILFIAAHQLYSQSYALIPAVSIAKPILRSKDFYTRGLQDISSQFGLRLEGAKIKSSKRPGFDFVLNLAFSYYFPANNKINIKLIKKTSRDSILETTGLLRIRLSDFGFRYGLKFPVFHTEYLYGQAGVSLLYSSARYQYDVENLDLNTYRISGLPNDKLKKTERTATIGFYTGLIYDYGLFSLSFRYDLNYGLIYIETDAVVIHQFTGGIILPIKSISK